MTERIYYTEPYRTEFEAEVVAIDAAAGAPAVILDRTAFCPTSGGQPFDTGSLGTARVVDVVDPGNGAIRHIVDGSLRPGEKVRGRVDWPRRFDHMQQHSGQHLLSAAFEHGIGARTVGFHLGRDSSTIDLDRLLSPDAIHDAEREANRVVWENRPVTIRFASEAEARELPLRKASARGGSIRLIEIEGYDLSACGGTHVDRTGAVGLVIVTSAERFRGGTRVSFLCGGRALEECRALLAVVAGSTQVLSVLPGELPAALERLQHENRQMRKEMKSLGLKLAAAEASGLRARAMPIGAVQLVTEIVDAADGATLKALASAVAATPGHVAALLAPAPADGGGTPWLTAIARAPDVFVDAAGLLRMLTGTYGGRGGGSRDLAQGGGLVGPPQEILDTVRAHLMAAAGQAPDAP